MPIAIQMFITSFGDFNLTNRRTTSRDCSVPYSIDAHSCCVALDKTCFSATVICSFMCGTSSDRDLAILRKPRNPALPLKQRNSFSSNNKNCSFYSPWTLTSRGRLNNAIRIIFMRHSNEAPTDQLKLV